MTEIPPPIVYLDQCHWITLARAQFARHKISASDELAAADFILKAASDGRIRLPLSGAHVIETTKARDVPRRRQLADTMLSAYGNWYMSNPVVVRGEELARALTQEGTSLDRDQVFNQRPGTPYGNYTPYPHNDQTLPLQMQRLVDELSWRLAWEDVLRSGTYEAAEWAAISGVIQGWASIHQNLSTYLTKHRANRDLRVVAAARTFDDLQQEITKAASQVGLTIDELEQRLHSGNLIEFFQQLPFVGRVMEITYLRLRNPQDVWVDNDLIDLIFLSCAAAYADFVVAEKKATHLLRQAAPQTSSGATVFATLSDLCRGLDF
jgi:hypothetical protein